MPLRARSCNAHGLGHSRRTSSPAAEPPRIHTRTFCRTGTALPPPPAPPPIADRQAEAGSTVPKFDICSARGSCRVPPVPPGNTVAVFGVRRRMSRCRDVCYPPRFPVAGVPFGMHVVSHPVQHVSPARADRTSPAGSGPTRETPGQAFALRWPGSDRDGREPRLIRRVGAVDDRFDEGDTLEPVVGRRQVLPERPRLASVAACPDGLGEAGLEIGERLEIAFPMPRRRPGTRLGIFR